MGIYMKGDGEKVRVTRKLTKGLGRLVIAVTLVLYLMPLIITFTNSLMSSSEVRNNYSLSVEDGMSGNGFITMDIVPDKVTLSQYSELLVDSPVYLSMFWNSVKIVLPIVIGQIVVSAVAAYAFTVLKFRGKRVLFFLYIIVMLLPLQVTLLPNYMVADWFGMEDSYLAIILPAVFHPFGVFLLRQYLKSMPDCYIEAAQMDGAGHLRILWSVILPMLKPGLAASAMLILLDYWNLVDQAVVFIQETKRRPLSIFLAQVGSEEMGLAFAGSVFYAVPVLVLLLYGQKYLKSGIAISGLR